MRGDHVVRRPPAQQRHQRRRQQQDDGEREDQHPEQALLASGGDQRRPEGRRRRRSAGTGRPARRPSASAGAGAGRPPRRRPAACPDRASRQDDARPACADPARVVTSGPGGSRGRRTARAAGDGSWPRCRPEADSLAARAARPPMASSTVPCAVATTSRPSQSTACADALERRAVGQADRHLGADRGGPGEVVLREPGGDRVAEDARSTAGSDARARAGRPAAAGPGRPSRR